MNQVIQNQTQFSFKDFYSERINHLLLPEALEIHYGLNPQFTKWPDYESKVQQDTMKSHDLAHIVFGCSTTLKGEMSVELWTLFANDLGFKKYMEIAQNSEINKEPFEIIKNIGYLKVLWVFTTNLWQIPYIFYLSTRMTKRWSFLNEEKYMQKTIGELRKELNIRLL